MSFTLSVMSPMFLFCLMNHREHRHDVSLTLLIQYLTWDLLMCSMCVFLPAAVQCVSVHISRSDEQQKPQDLVRAELIDCAR